MAGGGSLTGQPCAPCSNPLAGTDSTLLALSGLGYMGGKLFGFASCPRAVGAAEGMNVLAERRAPLPPHQGAQPYTLVVVRRADSNHIPIVPSLSSCSCLLGCGRVSAQQSGW